MRTRQAIVTPYASTTSREKPKKRPRRNLIKDRRSLAKPQRVNAVRNQPVNKGSPLSSPTVNNRNKTINWTKRAGKNLTQEGLKVT